MKMNKSLFKVSLISCLFLINTVSLFADIDIDATPSNWVDCPSTINGSCGFTYLGGVVQMDYWLHSYTNDYIRFRVRKCDQTNFSANGTVYIKDGDVCGAVVNSVNYSSGASTIAIDVPISYWVSGSKDFTITITSSSGERFNAGTVNIFKKCENYQVSNVVLSEDMVYQGQQNIDASCLMSNIGSEQGADDVTFFWSTDSNYDEGVDIDLGDENFNLLSGESITLTRDFDVPPTMPAGGYYIVAYADENNSDEECQEFNNGSFRYIQVLAASDLEITTLTTSTPEICQGGDLSVAYTIENNGDAVPSQNFTVRFYLSNNTTYGTNDHYIGFQNVSPIPINGSVNLDKDLNISTSIPNGDWYIIARVDYNNLIPEQNENNNTYVTPFEIDIFANPSPVYPTSNQTVSNLTPTLDWLSVSGANAYAVVIFDENLNDIHGENTSTNTYYNVPANVLDWNSTYYWLPAVNTANGNCPDDIGTAIKFFTPCLDTYEPNNSNSSPNTTAFQAFGGTADNQSIDSYITSEDDVDYFRITLETSGILDIDLTSLPANYDLELWYGDYSDTIATSINLGTTSEFIQYVHTGGTANFLIKLYSFVDEYDCDDSYALSLDWTPNGGGGGLELSQTINTDPSPIVFNRIGNFSTALLNNSSLGWSGDLRLELLDAAATDPPLNVIAEYNDVNMSPNGSFSIAHTTANPVVTVPDNYNLRVRYSDDNGATWQTVGNGGYTQPQPFEIVYSPIKLNTAFSIVPANIYHGEEAEFSVEVINYENSTFSDSIALQILDNNQIRLTDLDIDLVSLNINETHTLLMTTDSIQSAAGNYFLQAVAKVDGTWRKVYEGSFQNPFGFIIQAEPISIDITSPDQNSSFTSGDNLPINWTIMGTVGNISLELRDDADGFVALIADGISSATGSYNDYNLPICQVSGNYQIKAYETGTGDFEEHSETFTINQAMDCDCNITSPSTEDEDEVELVNAANWLCNEGIIIENDGDTRPYDNITRAELAKMVFITLFEHQDIQPSDAFPSPFLDLQNSNDWFYRFAKALSYLEYDDGTTPFDRNLEFQFRPHDPIERKYVLKVILEAFDIAEDGLLSEPYTDVDEMTDAYAYITKAYSLCLITDSQPTFRPDSMATRGEIFLMLYRLKTNSCATDNYVAPDPQNEDYFCPGNHKNDNLAREIGVSEGNFNHYSETSFSLDGVGLSLNFAHEYNSYLTDFPDDFFPVRPLGYGWTHTYNSYALDVPVWNEAMDGVEQKIIMVYPSGQMQVWSNPQSSYPYTCTSDTKGVYETLTVESDDLMTIKTPSQMIYTYEKMAVGNNSEEAFLMTKIEERNGHTINISYETGIGSAKRISSVVRELGNIKTSERTLNFSYESGTNYLSQVALNVSGYGGTTIGFDVNDDGDLKTFTDRMGAGVTYNYIKDTNPSVSDDEYNKKKHLLYNLLLPKGNTITNIYNKRKLNQTKVNNKLITNINLSENYDDATIGVTSSVNTFNTELDENTHEEEIEFDENNEGKAKCVTVNGDTQCFTYGDTNHPYHPTIIDDTNTGLEIHYQYETAYPNITLREIYLNGSAGELPDYTHSFGYNSYNDLVTYTDPKGNIVTNDYGVDASKGLVYSITDQENYQTQFTYYQPSDGQWQNAGLKTITSPEGIIITTTYDLYGNVNGTQAPANITTSAVFDPLGRVSSNTSPNGHQWGYQYYDNDLPHITTNPQGNTVEYTYDPNYNVTGIKNERGYTTTLAYETDTDLLKSVTFESNQIQYEYYTDGRVKKITKPDGTVIDVTYISSGNGLGQVQSDEYADYTYDSENRLKTVTKINGSDTHLITYHYDNLNRAISYDYQVTGSQSYDYTVGYAYDLNSNISTVVYPNLSGSGTLDVLYRYYDNNWLKEVEDWEGKITKFYYHADGTVDYMEYPNGSTCTYSYDPTTRRMIGKTDKRSDNSIIIEYAYVLDDVGNIQTETRTEPFANSFLQSLTQGATYKTNNFIDKVDGVTYQINQNGNLTSDGTNTYTWDNAYDVLQSVNSNVEHIYDGHGTRRERLDNGQRTRYIIDGLGMGNVIAETNGSGVPSAYYIYGGGGLLYRKIPNGGSFEDGYYHSNFQGSTIAITDESEVITHEYAYDPYGNIIQKNEADVNPFTFVGKYGVMRETDSFYFMRARFYDAGTGRFISQDPIWITNLFAYGEGNPVMQGDPKGLNAEVFAGSVAGMPAGVEYFNVVDNTLKAFSHYVLGNGEPVIIGEKTTNELLKTDKFKEKHNTIINGKTSSLTGFFSVNLEPHVYHIGNTEVDYKISCQFESCIVHYDLFVRDGFWDADDIDEYFLGEKLNLSKFQPDGKGPNLERFNGTPYDYISKRVSYPFYSTGYLFSQ